jgi:hypothetical protein
MAGPFDELRFPESLRESVSTAPPGAARWLEGANSREVLQRLVDGDRLGIEARCACGIRERALLISTSSRLRLGVLTRTARSRALARTLSDDFDGPARFIAHAYAT